MKKILLDMYLRKNLGDDLFLKIVAKRYPNAKFYATTQTKYRKCDSIEKNVILKRNLFTMGINFLAKLFKEPKLKFFHYLQSKVDAQVTVGGSMFIEGNLSEQELKKSLYVFYPTNKPYFILGSNFGPYRSDYYKLAFENVFAGANDVCFREKTSRDMFALENLRNAPDIVFSLDIKEFQDNESKQVAISVIDLATRPSISKYKELYENKIAELIVRLQDIGYKVILMSFCKAEGDERAIRSILKKCSHSVRMNVGIYKYRGDIKTALKTFSASEYIIGTRLHSIVLGYIFGKKVIPIIYSDKTEHVLKELGTSGSGIEINKINELNVENTLARAMTVPNIAKIVEQSEWQFAVLDKFMKSNDDRKSEASRQKQLARNTIIIAVGKFFTQFLTFLLLPVYTNFLSTSDYGTADLILTYITLLVPVVTVQQEMATFRYLVDARENKKKVGDILRTSIRSVATRLACFVIPLIAVAFFVDFNYKYLALAAILSCAFSNLLLQAARGLGKNLQYSVASVISGIITLVANIVLICGFGWGAESLLISMAVANAVCALYLIFALRISKYFQSGKNDRKLKREMLKYSWPLVPNGISWWLINASDRTIVSIILGTAANGIYAVANKIPAIVGGFVTIFSLSWSESASLHINDKDKDKFFSDVANNTLKIFSVLCAGLIMVLPFVFNIIVGPDYVEAYNYIPIFILAALFNCMVTVYSAIYVAKKMTKQVASTSIMSAVINIVVDLTLINFIGLYAAVISTAVAYFIMMIYRHHDLKKYVRIRYQPRNIFLSLVIIIAASTFYYLYAYL